MRDLARSLEVMGHIGYQAMLKASAGGGSRGIRALRSESDLVASFDATRRDAMGSFGSDVVFMERMVEGARHVEAQAVADAHGNVLRHHDVHEGPEGSIIRSDACRGATPRPGPMSLPRIRDAPYRSDRYGTVVGRAAAARRSDRGPV